MTPSFPEQAVNFIQAQKPNFTPLIGIVLGSGLGSLVEHLTNATYISYASLPGFPISTIEGHAGQLVLGELEGVPVVCLQGRVHYYEGAQNDKIKNMVRTLKLLGCTTFLATNAAGSLRSEVGAGEVVLVSDHINMQGNNPLIGSNDVEFGERFIAMHDAYDKALRQQVQQVAQEQGYNLREGVYLAALGPMFETPAEIRAFRILGADLVGMSTVSEVIVARHCGLKVVVLSAVTNLAAGMSDESITHEGTLHFAGQAAARLIGLVKGFVRKVQNG